MEFIVLKNDLIDKLQRVSNVIVQRSTLPVLANVLLEAKDGSLSMTTTDLEIRLSARLDAEVSVPGRTTMPAKTFLLMVKGLPGEKIKMSCDSSHHMRIETENSSYNLFGLAPDDFPEVAPFSPLRRFTVKQDELVRLLSRIGYAASTDESRKMLNGVLFSVKEGAFTAVATDGKRLALVEKVVEGFTGDDGQAIVPSKSVMEVQRLFSGGNEDVSIEFGAAQACFSMSGRSLYSKLIDGSYPNYRQVIPTSFSNKIELQSDVFSGALQRISNVVSESNGHVKFTVANNSITMKAASSDIGEGFEKINVSYSKPEEISLSFNPLFVLAPFKHLDADKVILQLNDGYNPVALSCGDGFLYVLMPMRNK
ncbi:MAG: DNA polymerase III subunit beta [Victivallales bacterium]|nr:DNA polymerase III subunit beta [Victivallales bacterium]